MAENLKILAAYATPIEADMARNRLEASGVRAFLADEYTVGWLWHLGTGLHGVKVLVAESDLPRALEILEDFRQTGVQGEPPPAWSCPKCSAEVDGEMEICWACGTTAEGVEDADFQNAEAAVTPTPTKQVGPKRPPGVWLALLIAFCIPMFVFNVLVGIDFFVSQAVYPISGGPLVLVLAGDVLLVVGLFQSFYYQPPGLPDVEAPAVEQEEREPAVLDADAMVRRACLAAVLGMVFCPLLLNIYSIWLILRYELYRPAVHRKPVFLVYTAIVINAVVLVVSLLLFLAAGGFAWR